MKVQSQAAISSVYYSHNAIIWQDHLTGELALDGVAVAQRQRRLIVGQLLEAGEAVVPIGQIVRTS